VRHFSADDNDGAPITGVPQLGDRLRGVARWLQDVVEERNARFLLVDGYDRVAQRAGPADFGQITEEDAQGGGEALRIDGLVSMTRMLEERPAWRAWARSARLARWPLPAVARSTTVAAIPPGLRRSLRFALRVSIFAGINLA
jgi:hypothetical protein